MQFVQPDSIIPDPSNPQSLNRFSYVRNNPLIFIDPTGHTECRLEPEECKYIKNLQNNNSGGGSVSSGSKLDNKNKGSNNCITVTCRSRNGDVDAIVELILPSHAGWRVQFEGTAFIFSGTVGVNGYYSFREKRFAGIFDWSIGGGPGYGAGIAATTGPLVGWGSSQLENLTSGNSILLGGSAAAELAITTSVSAPLGESGLYIDPHYGQTPATAYFGGGVGGAFADAGLSYSGTFTWSDILNALPWSVEK